MRSLISLPFVLSLALVACEGTSNTPPEPIDELAEPGQPVPEIGSANGMVRRYGAAVRVGNGLARAYTIGDPSGRSRPIEIGVAMDERSMEGLPAATAHGSGSGSEHDHGGAREYLVPLPQRHGTDIQLIELNWNPAGHEPPGIYDIPHFDFHFYTINKAQRDSMSPADPQFMTKAGRYPSADFIPPGYVVLPPAPAPIPVVPRMGVHWSNVTSPELQPPSSPNHARFTQTFIHGSYNGQFIFTEPMITRDFLLTKPDLLLPLSQPARVPSGALVATAYRVRWDAQAREYRIALTGLTVR
jgi:hypothetical protein